MGRGGLGSRTLSAYQSYSKPRPFRSSKMWKIRFADHRWGGTGRNKVDSLTLPLEMSRYGVGNWTWFYTYLQRWFPDEAHIPAQCLLPSLYLSWPCDLSLASTLKSNQHCRSSQSPESKRLWFGHPVLTELILREAVYVPRKCPVVLRVLCLGKPLVNSAEMPAGVERGRCPSSPELSNPSSRGGGHRRQL